MKQAKPHFRPHQHEALLTGRRFHAVNALLVTSLVVVGGLALHQNFAQAASDHKVPAFVANTTTSGSTISSSDRLASANIPSGALTVDGSCAIVSLNDSASSLPPQDFLLAGPYKFDCKFQNGGVVPSFGKNVIITVGLSKSQAANFAGFAALSYNPVVKGWDSYTSTYNPKTRTVIISTNTPLDFAVVAEGRHSYFNFFAIILLILAVVGGVILLRWRQKQKQEYDQYISHKYYNF